MVQEGITQFLSDDSHANDSSGTSVISSLKKENRRQVCMFCLTSWNIV